MSPHFEVGDVIQLVRPRKGPMENRPLGMKAVVVDPMVGGRVGLIALKWDKSITVVTSLTNDADAGFYSEDQFDLYVPPRKVDYLAITKGIVGR